MRAPSELPNPLCGTTTWLLSRFGFTLALLLLAVPGAPLPPSYCPSISTDLEWHLCAEASSAEAAPAQTNGTDNLGDAAPAPAAPLKQGQVAQPGKQAVAPKRAVNKPASYYAKGDGCQWVLFWAGLFFLLPSYVAVVLPLCSRPRFPTRSDKCVPPFETLCLAQGICHCSL